MKLRSTSELVGETFEEWISDGVSQLAAGIAFYTIFSLSPILIIFVAVVGSLYGKGAAQAEIIEQSRTFIGPRGAQIVETALQDAHATSGIATLVGIAGLLVGATVVFVSLQNALNTIWGVAPRPGWNIWPFFKKRMVSFLMVLGLGFILLISLMASTAVAAFVGIASGILPAAGRYLGVLDFVLWFLVLTVSFAVIYKVLPDVHIAWRDVGVGAAAAALLFSVGKSLISAYLAHSATTAPFGAASSLAVFLLWIYYSAQIFLLCGEFTQVYAKRYGTGITPKENFLCVLKTYAKHTEDKSAKSTF